MICFILCFFVLPPSPWVGLCVPAGIFEILYVYWWLTWRSETRDMPKMHYRAFMRIEQVAPDKWAPSDPSRCQAKPRVPGTVFYNINGRYMDWEIICMKTFPEAIVFELGYHRKYRKRVREQAANNAIERCLESWKKDVKDYQDKASKLIALEELHLDCSSRSKDELDRLKSIGNGQSKMPDLFSMDDASLYKDRRFWESCAEYVSGGKHGTDDN